MDNRRVLRGVRTDHMTIISTGEDYMPVVHDPNDPVCQKCTIGSCKHTCLRNTKENNQDRTDWNWGDSTVMSSNVVNIPHPPVDLDAWGGQPAVAAPGLQLYDGRRTEARESAFRQPDAVMEDDLSGVGNKSEHPLCFCFKLFRGRNYGGLQNLSWSAAVFGHP